MENTRGSKKIRKIGPYLLLRSIGKGAFSVVYEAKIENSNLRYAVKQISLVNVTKKHLKNIHL